MMHDNRIDFADLTAAEIAAGAPIQWPTWANFIQVGSLVVADAILPPARWIVEMNGLVIRWGDERFDKIMALWHRKLREKIEREEGARASSAEEIDRYAYYRMHDGAKVDVVLPGLIINLHPIPKSLGTQDTDSDKDPLPLLDREFNPRIYHRKSIAMGAELDVIPIGAPPAEAEQRLTRRGQDRIVYVESRDFVFSVHLGSHIDQQPEPVLQEVADE